MILIRLCFYVRVDTAIDVKANLVFTPTFSFYNTRVQSPWSDVIEVIFVQHWVDEFLSWNPAKYGNMTRIIVPPTHIWLPDFGLENRCVCVRMYVCVWVT